MLRPIFISSLQHASDMVDMVESGLINNFSTKPLLPCQLIRDREFQLVNGNDVDDVTWGLVYSHF